MKARILLMLALVVGAALLARGASAQPTIGGDWLGFLYDVAVNPASNRVYVTHDGASGVRVTIIDGATKAVIAAVPLGARADGVAVNPTTGRVYVAGSNGLSVLDGATNTVVATVPVGLVPVDAAVNPTTNLIYVVNRDSNNVSVIDGGANTVVATIAVSDWHWPHGVAVNAATNRIYVTNLGNNSVSVIDGATNTVVATVPVGSWPMDVAVNPNTNLIYVANEDSRNVSVIDGTTNRAIATIPVHLTLDGVPVHTTLDVAVNPTTNHAYVPGYGNVAVIDGATNSVVTTIRVPAEARAVAVNPVTGLVYVGATVGGMEIWLSELYVFEDSPGAAPPPAPSPTPTPLPPPTPAVCLPAPAPPLAEGMEWVALQCGTCNAVTSTYPDSTLVGDIVGAVLPAEALNDLWRFEGAMWTGYSPHFPAASDLTEVDRLDVVFICVESAATFTRPVP